MAQTVCNGDVTVVTIPQAFADLAGSVTSGQLPGGAPTGSGAVVMASGATLSSPSLVTPALGTPASGNLANCTFPVLNQNTSGSSASCTGNAATATTASACSGNSATATSTTTAAGLSATLAIASGGTAATSAAAALTSLGAAPTASPTFTGTVGAAAITATGTVQGATVTSTGAVNAGTSKFVVNSSGLCTTYNNVALTGAGIPSEVGIATATTATAAVAATNLLAAPVAATVYLITCYLKVTVATSTPVAGPVTITYADKDGVAQSVVMAMQNAAGAIATTTGSTTTTPISGTLAIYANSGTAIKYAIGFSGTGTFEYVFKCEAL